LDGDQKYFLFGTIEYYGQVQPGSGQTSGHYSAMIKKHGWKYISDEYQNSLDPPTHSSKCIFLAYSNKFIKLYNKNLVCGLIIIIRSPRTPLMTKLVFPIPKLLTALGLPVYLR